MKLCHTKHILLIEDDEDDRQLFEQVMEIIAPDMVPTCLPDANGLMETIESIQPFLIFIDYRLPKRNGIECLKQIKAHPHFKHIPVVMWSTTGAPANIQAAHQAGAWLYLEKPLSVAAWIQQLKNVFEKVSDEASFPQRWSKDRDASSFWQNWKASLEYLLRTSKMNLSFSVPYQDFF